MRIGIVGCADIALKRFLPAAATVEGVESVAVAEEYAPERLKAFQESFGLEGMTDYRALIRREDLDAVYVPQPPALHCRWAREALLAGKHVLVEKPSGVTAAETRELVGLAREKGLALHENYMFQYHSQIRRIREILDSGEIGEARLYRAAFGFPMRAKNDFRYTASLGGGALLDAGGYTVKLASLLLGETVWVDAARLSGLAGFEVDMYGSAQLSNADGAVCQVSFGMDCAYQCKLEIWGSKGMLTADRIFTAPADFTPMLEVVVGGEKKSIQLEADNHFARSIEMFLTETRDDGLRENMYAEMIRQAELVEEIRRLAAAGEGRT